MTLMTASAALHPLRRCTSADRVMWITPDRVFYAGLLGNPTEHVRGAIVLYFALEAPVRLSVEGGPWLSADVMLVQPYVPHSVACDARHVGAVYIEPETVDLDQLPALLRGGSGPLELPGLAAHLRACHARVLATGQGEELMPSDFDPLFFGQAFAGRRMDARIAEVLDTIKANPSAPATAEECANQVSLSFSRFLHLFKAEVGVPFRSFRTWRRARSLLHYVDRSYNLAQVALDIGYPDSTHFSHSIRQTYGLKPRDIFAGSRKLRMLGEPLAGMMRM
ncbi:AraC family transcriptional regulator [Xenophilus arseniciresistens]|uniref:AraC family transcriptional regulator n=1 Tax=Xenophilus arseniciresistens TaxID=1283306 RepID=A0AAE3N525_9BURK|nr:AraC family transcriptional regulator [Xenophilus arseniciresistens]MDA7416010.1 AraC family transcriptional regulator [Xenophilus arseniciresistens]